MFAARQASKAWSRQLGRADSIDNNGVPVPKERQWEKEEPVANVDETVFLLAVLDKCFERVWLETQRRVATGTTQAYPEWALESDGVIREVYDQAAMLLLDTPPPKSTLPPPYEDVWWFVRDVLDLSIVPKLIRVLDLKFATPLPTRPDGIPPFPLPVLGRFAAKFFSVKIRSRFSDRRKSKVETVPAATPPPPPGQTIDERALDVSAGLDVNAKDLWFEMMQNALFISSGRAPLYETGPSSSSEPRSILVDKSPRATASSPTFPVLSMADQSAHTPTSLSPRRLPSLVPSARRTPENVPSKPGTPVKPIRDKPLAGQENQPPPPSPGKCEELNDARRVAKRTSLGRL